MADADRLYTEQTNPSTTSIIDISRYLKNENTSEPVFIESLLVKNKIEDIKDIIESQIMELVAKDLINSKNIKNNPFDSIYLCDLKPDMIYKSDINFIKQLSNKIVDKSFEISFDDGLDD